MFDPGASLPRSPKSSVPSIDVGRRFDLADAAFVEQVLSEQGLRCKIVPLDPEARLFALHVTQDVLDRVRTVIEELGVQDCDPRAQASSPRSASLRANRIGAAVMVVIAAARYGTRWVHGPRAGIAATLVVAAVCLALLGDWDNFTVRRGKQG